MTDADKAALVARIRQAETDAAKRGLRLTGYRLDGDRLTFSSEPAKRVRVRASEDAALRAALKASTTTRRVIRRGAVQGSLL